jgi:cytochrome P450
MPAPDVLHAATAADPYPLYAELVAQRPCYFDEPAKAYVVSGAAEVRCVLADPGCRVRPADQPVPAGIVATPAGEVFGQLVRMTDGSVQQRLKALVSQALGSVDVQRVAELTRERGRQLLAESDQSLVQQAMFDLPALVVAGLCGLDSGADAAAARLIGEFVLCLPATATPDQQARAAAAAAALQDLMGPRLRRDAPDLLGELVRAALRADWPGTAPLLANGIGLLSQTYDATAALIGNTLCALGREQSPLTDAFVREVARHDSPVQNTRRFAATPVLVSDRCIPPGAAILVLLAAANRDPAANPDPAAFRTDRAAPQLFTFGAAGHGCPGESLAISIAGAAVGTLLEAGVDPSRLSQHGYWPSGNIRCPEFGQTADATTATGQPTESEPVR